LGDHAEEGLVEKLLMGTPVAGATVYTTLEPCTTRSRLPCANILSEHKVSRVVVGMLDPDQRITGKGILYLRKHGIAVDLFPTEMMAELEELNRDFIRDKEAESARLLSSAEVLSLRTFRSRADLPEMALWPAAQAATDMLLIGQNLNAVFRQPNFFREKLREGCRIRLLMANPNDDTLLTIMSRGVVEHHYTKDDFKPALKTIRDLRNSLPEERQSQIELKTVDYVPTLSFQVLDGTLKSGVILVELTPNRIEVKSRPHVVLSAANPAHKEWYKNFLRNCEDMYQEANSYEWQ
jgi:hypothetical protein